MGIYSLIVIVIKVINFLKNRINFVVSLSNSLNDILNHLNFIIKIAAFNKEVRKEILFYHIHQHEIEDLVGLDFIGGLLECVLATETIEGDIIELGTYKGGTSIIIAHFLKRTSSKKQVYACDTFEGHPYNDKFSLTIQSEGMCSDTSVLYIQNKFRRFGVADKISIIKGQFEDTLHKELGEKRFSLEFIDCDLYDSTKYAFNFLIPRMANNGVITLHDYGSDLWGLTNAINEQCRINGLKVNPYPIPHIKIVQS